MPIAGETASGRPATLEAQPMPAGGFAALAHHRRQETLQALTARPQIPTEEERRPGPTGGRSKSLAIWQESQTNLTREFGNERSVKFEIAPDF
jgi:hypothetical protein